MGPALGVELLLASSSVALSGPSPWVSGATCCSRSCLPYESTLCKNAVQPSNEIWKEPVDCLQLPYVARGTWMQDKARTAIMMHVPRLATGQKRQRGDMGEEINTGRNDERGTCGVNE